MGAEDMGIRLSIEITSPLTPDDRDLLSGIAVMTLAIANRELAEQGFPETFPPKEDEQAADAQPCGLVNSASESETCVSPVGHRGRHRFRRLPVETTNGLAN
jgi:hypothetical protein